jgi:pyruvate formate lyase activating enzyme
LLVTSGVVVDGIFDGTRERAVASRGRASLLFGACGTGVRFVSKAVVFDVQRYSVHDGPGIRTVVFLKGCPLRCQWCQNPEALRRSPEIGFLLERCIACRNCEESCPEEAILRGDKRIDRARCTVCAACVETCHAEALRMVGEEFGEETLLAEVSRDRPFYEDSGGGVTLSGGEPLLQIDFVERFSSRCREEGLSLVVETSGAVPFDSFRRILPFVDLVFFDVKAIDPVLHEAWTGSRNEVILSNLERLRLSGVPVIPRVPIVPSFTALPSNLNQIAAHLGDSFPEVHLLPYHRWGESKRALVDSPQPSLHLDPPDEEDMVTIAEIFEAKGVAVRIGG